MAFKFSLNHWSKSVRFVNSYLWQFYMFNINVYAFYLEFALGIIPSDHFDRKTPNNWLSRDATAELKDITAFRINFKFDGILTSITIANEISLHESWWVQFIWTASSEFGTYRLCEKQRFRRACASTQSRQNLRCSLIQAVSQEEPSDRKPDPWPLWMAGHVQLKFVMTECSKTQIHLTGPICQHQSHQSNENFTIGTLQSL